MTAIADTTPTTPAEIARILDAAATALAPHHHALRRLAYASPPGSDEGAHLALLSAAFSVDEARSDLAAAAALITTWWPGP